MTDHLAYVFNTTALWLSLCSGGILATAGGAPLGRAAVAGWRSLWCKSATPGKCFEPVARELDGVYIRLLSALTTPASALVLYVGAALMGAGIAGASAGSIIRMVGYDLIAADWLRWTMTPVYCIGIACVRAAISPRRTLSAWTSGAFIFAGAGIGAVAGTMHP